MITVIPFQLNVFLAEHVIASRSVADVLLISGGDASELHPHLRKSVAFRRVGIVRPIRPWADLVALVQIIRIIRAERPDIVQTLAPKAGLLGMFAAFVCRVPVRVHWFTGQVWATSRWLKRSILKSVDRLIAMLATDPLVDSPSQRDFLVSEGIAPRSRLSVLGSGSVRGVDDVRFRPDAAVRASTRQSLGIPKDRTVLVFVGRITRDKGLLELARAMRELRQELPGLHAILVGFEEGDFARELAAEVGDASDRVSIVGYSDTPGAIPRGRGLHGAAELSRGLRRLGHRGCVMRAADDRNQNRRSRRCDRRRRDWADDSAPGHGCTRGRNALPRE